MFIYRIPYVTITESHNDRTAIEFKCSELRYTNVNFPFNYGRFFVNGHGVGWILSFSRQK